MIRTTLGARVKDPDETRVFTMDWTAHLRPPGGSTTETIATSTWILPSDLTLVSSSIVTGGLKTSALISGGIAGRDYVVTNRITTNESGETLDRSGTIAVRHR
jgi:hypothetical protein